MCLQVIILRKDDEPNFWQLLQPKLREHIEK